MTSRKIVVINDIAAIIVAAWCWCCFILTFLLCRREGGSLNCINAQCQGPTTPTPFSRGKVRAPGVGMDVVCGLESLGIRRERIAPYTDNIK